MKTLKSTLILFALSLALTVTACISESESHTGVSQADFDALVARVDALEAQAHDPVDTADFATASALSAVEGKIRDEVLVSAPTGSKLEQSVNQTSGGTELGCIPAGPECAHKVVNTDRRYTVLYSTTTGGIRHARQTFYEAEDCIGDPYVVASQFTPASIGNGLVFSDIHGTWYVEKGQEKVSVTIQSALNNGNNCVVASSEGPVTLDAYPAQPNDPSVTGVSGKVDPRDLTAQ